MYNKALFAFSHYNVGSDFCIPVSPSDKTSSHCFCFKRSQKNLHANTIIASVAIPLLNCICSFIATENFYYLDLLANRFIFWLAYTFQL